ncbi:MAG: nodulation protein NfeD [Wenzhouxiangellaceae bacterium]
MYQTVLQGLVNRSAVGRLWSWLAVAALWSGLAAPVPAQEAPPARVALVLEVADAIGPATRDYVVRGIEQAESTGAALVILKLDTPGGLDASMRDIIRKILGARVPVVTWVAPAGARAASAGTYILYASHVAAMAPATHLGAATPVQIGAPAPSPASPEPGETPDEADEPNGARPSSDQTTPDSALERKAVNDAVAYIRGLAQRHGRNAEWAEAAVRDAVTLTAEEALDQGVIDLIAASLPALLEAIDGRTVQMDDGRRTLRTEDLEIAFVAPDWRTRLLAILTNPTLAYILLMVGIYGLLLEGYNPGALLPGVVGAICLLLALYAFQVLPVNYAGLALILLGLSLIAVELFVPSFGVLGVGGVVAVVIGSVILFDRDVPGFAVNAGVIGAVGLFSALIFALVMYLGVRSLKKPRLDPIETLVGQPAEAVDEFRDGRGRVHIAGEDWLARASRPVRRGQTVRIVRRLQGLELEVEPVEGRNGN